MDNETKCCLFCCVAAVGIVASIMTGCTMQTQSINKRDTDKFKAATEAGLEQRILPGGDTPVWVKAGKD